MGEYDQKYIFHLSHDFIDLRWAELNSIVELHNKPNCIKNATYTNESGLFLCELPSRDIAQKIAERCVLLKSISDLYYEADTLEKLLPILKSQAHLPCEILPKDTIKIDFYSFGKTYTEPEKLERIEQLANAVEFEKYDVKVCLNNKLVKHRFVYFEDWIHTKSAEDNNNNMVDGPVNDNETNSSKNKYLRGVYFGKYLYEGQNRIVPKFSLKERGFISNTSMDPCLSLVMSNLGHADKNKIVIDPFVGSGSLLVGAAYYGAHVMGADLDYNLVNAIGLSSRQGQKYRKKSENIRNNLKQYGLEDKFLDVLVADFSKKYIKENHKFDAIITDPPYGIRERAIKLGNKKKSKSDENQEVNQRKSDVNSESTLAYIPQKCKYLLSDIFTDLLDYAIEHLVENGRLVFWLPIHTELDRSNMTDEEILMNLLQYVPTSDGLKLVSVNEQRLSRFTSRLLITMIRDDELPNGSIRAVNRKYETLNNFHENYFKRKN